MKKRAIRKIPALLLALLLIFNPSFAGFVLSEAEEPADPVVEESSTESINEAVAEETESAEVTNENEANVENNTEVEANTGNNEITPGETVDADEEIEASSNPEEEAGAEGEGGLPSEEEVEPEDGEEELGELEVEPLDEEESEEEILSEEVVAENQSTPPDSENTAVAADGEITEVANVNEAEVKNNVDTAAQTGENQASGDETAINTGEADAGADLVNVVNTNLVGEDFWQVIINVFEDSQENLDLSQIEGLENLDFELISILAQNLNTGSDSTNLALACYLSLLSIYNDNTATLTNNLDLLASTGQNQVIGDDGEVITGDAEAYLNLFNMINTNLIGSDWFFGMINLFGELEGDIILPNELAFLGEGGENGESLTVAANINSGEGSVNQAIAGSNQELNVCNNNEADLDNNVSILANTGNNEIVGTGEIETGDADANLNLFNMVNTNIVGSRWVLLVINNFGDWVGEVLGWWGNMLSFGNTTLLWVQLPSLDDGEGGTTMALNANTGEGSDNLALAQNQDMTVIENHNLVTVENNISVVADSGNNSIEGETASINTGNANASANIFNFLNTNIIGNNWYFCMINIFDRFIGNILFSRPEPEEPNQENDQPSPEVIVASSTGTGTGGVSEFVCNDQPPGGAPKLLSAVGGENSVTLTWEKAPDPVSYYLVAYGEESGNYIYGSPNIGGAETTSYTVNNLSGGKTYYFVIRAGNGCAPGPFSNELSTAPYGAVLGAKTADFGVADIQAAEGELGEALADVGEVAGAQSKSVPWWLIFSLAGASLLGAAFRGLFLFLRRG